MALVGIARLASQGELLEAKRSVQYFEIPSRSILNRTKPNMPFQWTINPYRGCEFGCKYCYARYTHEFMEMDAFDFEDKIYAKTAAAHLLRQELGASTGRTTSPSGPRPIPTSPRNGALRGRGRFWKCLPASGADSWGSRRNPTWYCATWNCSGKSLGPTC